MQVARLMHQLDVLKQEKDAVAADAGSQPSSSEVTVQLNKVTEEKETLQKEMGEMKKELEKISKENEANVNEKENLMVSYVLNMIYTRV